MKHTNLIYILIVILFISCRRGGDASGKVINILNGKPVGGLTIHLDEYKIKLITDKTVTKPIESTTTDSNGEYFFKYGAKIETRYKNRLISIDKNLFSDMDTSAVLDIKYEIGHYPGCEKVKWDYNGHSRKNQDFFIAPLARIKVVPHNVTHVYDGVTLRIDLYDDNYSQLASYYDSGNITNTNYYTQFPSNGRINIVWQFQSSIYQNFYDTIHVEPFTKTTYHFNY